MTKQLKLSALVAAMVLSASAFAAKPGYTADQSTDAVTRNNYGECWRTNFFDKASEGLVECGDAVAAKPAPAAPVYSKEKVTLSAEVLFDFDKATLRAEARNELDPLVNRLKADANLRGVEVAGHTDFLGSDKYNQSLSERRANAVKDYFVAAGVAAEKVVAVGRGETETKMSQECEAKKFKKRADLKACLAPDRRVDVTIETVKTVVQ